MTSFKAVVSVYGGNVVSVPDEFYIKQKHLTNENIKQKHLTNENRYIQTHANQHKGD